MYVCMYVYAWTALEQGEYVNAGREYPLCMYVCMYVWDMHGQP